ncbi:hypothetical protein [Salipiger marinus]|uniref:hypothetical protein n=1 Tax=Salipiger marinus TaxID=555512 RepID=UPI0010425E9C|nr:hypothetical protein [Salipiger marinus]
MVDRLILRVDQPVSGCSRGGIARDGGEALAVDLGRRLNSPWRPKIELEPERICQRPKIVDRVRTLSVGGPVLQVLDQRRVSNRF